MTNSFWTPKSNPTTPVAALSRMQVETLESRVTPATLYGLLNNGTQLIQFDTATPNSTSTPLDITGLQAGEGLLGIDIRPANGLLYGLGASGRVYTLDPATAAITSTVVLTAPLNGTSFGVDFNPAADRLRVTSDLGQNLRINVDTGATIVDGALNGGSASLPSAAYTNSLAGTTTTQEYGIDAATDSLYLFSSPNGGTNALVGALGVDFSIASGFDISTNGLAYASLTVAGVTQLYSINLVTGAATAIGPIGAGNLNVGGLALVQPPRPVLAYSSDGIRLISFNTGSPNAAIASTAYVGLQPGEVVLGIDFRPANGLLYALGSTSRVYTIDPRDRDRDFDGEPNGRPERHVVRRGLQPGRRPPPRDERPRAEPADQRRYGRDHRRWRSQRRVGFAVVGCLRQQRSLGHDHDRVRPRCRHE